MGEKQKEKEIITCKWCGSCFSKDDLQRSCSNCFACMGCEMYICAVCRSEIVVKEMQKKQNKDK
jgi:hypothetical protein